MSYKSKAFFFAAAFFCFAVSVQALDVPPLPREVESILSRLPIQHNGRVKPFDSFARETLSQITGSTTFGKETPVATVLHMVAFPEKWENEAALAVPYRPLREELGISSRQSHLSYQGLFAAGFMKRLPPIVQKESKEEKLTILENEVMDLYGRFTAIHGVFSGELRVVPSENKKETIWLPLTHLSELSESDRKKIVGSWEDFLSAYRDGNRGKMLETLSHFKEILAAFAPSAWPSPWRLSLEVWYYKIDPLRWAWLFYLFAVFFFSLTLRRRSKKFYPASLAIFLVALTAHLGGIVMRVILSGRPPVSNFYESMLWLPLVTAVIGLILELKARASFFALSSAIFAGGTLILSEHLPLDPSIQPIVAVLRSNKWLAIHVLTIVSSYGVLSLATGIAHFYAGSVLLKKKKSLPLLGDTLYRVVQIGVVLLAAGIMLGAVWANASWGRYWGWDPKETWALITLLWFLALLHARKAGWMGAAGLSIGTILGFFLLLMTYYGVSFYLVGLHSYAGGHAKPIPPLLIGYLIAECAFLLWVGATVFRKKKLSPIT